MGNSPEKCHEDGSPDPAVLYALPDVEQITDALIAEAHRLVRVSSDLLDLLDLLLIRLRHHRLTRGLLPDLLRPVRPGRRDGAEEES